MTINNLQLDKSAIKTMYATMRAKRIRKNIPAITVANALGIDKSTFSKYEQGLVDVCMSKMIVWCAVLELNPRYPGQCYQNHTSKSQEK